MKFSSIRHMPVLAGLIFVLAAISAPASAFGLTVSTDGATNVNQSSATLNLTLKEKFGTPIAGALYGFQYGTTAEYGSESEPKVLEPGLYSPVYLADTVKNLAPETTYHYRAGAIDSKGNVVFGADRTFTTPALPKFQADQYTATLTGEQDPSAKLGFSVEGGTIACSEVSVTGALTGASTSLGLTPTYPAWATKCTGLGFLEITVKPNGCSYVFQAPAVTGGSGSMDIACPGGSSIEILAGPCKLSIPAQTGLSSVAIGNVSEPSRLDLDLSIGGLKYTKTQDGFLCPFNGTGEKQDGGFSGSLSVGASKAGKAVGLQLK